MAGTEAKALPAEEAHKRDCLARWALSLGTKAERREWLERFERRNGAAIADDLRERMKRIYREGVR